MRVRRAYSISNCEVVFGLPRRPIANRIAKASKAQLFPCAGLPIIEGPKEAQEDPGLVRPVNDIIHAEGVVDDMHASGVDDTARLGGSVV